MTPDAGKTGNLKDTKGDTTSDMISELEKRKQLLLDEIAGLTRDRDKLWDESRAQVMRMMREFVIEYFDEDFATAFHEFSEKHRPKENKIEIYG
jgi:hypothetical protein